MRSLTPSKEGPSSGWAIRSTDSRSISPDYLALKNGDDLSVYRVHVLFDVSDDNPTYYSRDGILYLKSNDEKVECAGFMG